MKLYCYRLKRIQQTDHCTQQTAKAVFLRSPRELRCRILQCGESRANTHKRNMILYFSYTKTHAFLTRSEEQQPHAVYDKSNRPSHNQLKCDDSAGTAHSAQFAPDCRHRRHTRRVQQTEHQKTIRCKRRKNITQQNGKLRRIARSGQHG